MRTLRIILAASVLMTAGAAEARRRKDETPKPVGISSGPDSLRRSPCACIQQPNPKSLPDFLAETGMRQS